MLPLVSTSASLMSSAENAKIGRSRAGRYSGADQKGKRESKIEEFQTCEQRERARGKKESRPQMTCERKQEGNTGDENRELPDDNRAPRG